ncbi:hypothetical protein EBZ39_05575 [bacterium]|nr:hypothetical protein [bacterium]
MWKNSFLLFVVGALALIGCQKNTTSGFSTKVGIVLDSTVPEDQRNLIDQDLYNLSQLNLSVTSSDLQVLNINSFSGSEMVSWFKTRVSYIVGESFDYSEQAYIVGTVSYRPQIYASTLLDNDFLAQNSLVTIMVNIGSALYRYGKNNSRVLTLDVGGQTLYIKSPRIGVIQIGEGLFTSWSVRNTARDTLANSLIRLSVFFHEARHSDGNGDNVTFPHALCPDWHDYSGNYSCDNSANGPYVVDSIMLKNLRNACTNCSNTEIQTFKAFQADAESRLLPNSTFKDVRPEQIP